ncbi:BAR/IMD domain-containing adapter protein 2-like 2 [Stigmatopora argus]
MSTMHREQLHRSTLGIYSSLMDEFNPGLQNLVSLGHSYARAFQALAVKSEAYFTALSQMGEQAFHSLSSRSIGDVLIQIAESQKKLTLELEEMFHWFTEDILQEMDGNIRLDKDYISGSRKKYEMSVHGAAMDRRLDRHANQDGAEDLQFLRESHSEALKEEERRYRFLAEKHCGLIQSISHLMNKNGGSLQIKADCWKEEINATRGSYAIQPTLDSPAQTRQENRKKREEQPLGKIPSRPPSPQGSIYRSAAESSGGLGRTTRARVAHQPDGSNQTLLHFARGEMITVLVQQTKNGWLYGHIAGNNSRQGWFPAAYVEEVDDLPVKANLSNSALRGRSNSSVSSRMDAPGTNTPSPPPPPPPLLQRQSSNKFSQMQTGSSNKTTESNPEKKRSQPHASKPELFPRGTNPFATVKLKPTSTNDRSAPRLYR